MRWPRPRAWNSGPAAPRRCEALGEFRLLVVPRRPSAARPGQEDAAFDLLKRDPRHPSLRLKKVGDHWSARVGLRYRALATEVDGGLLWFWIGSHADYDHLLR